MKSFHAEEGHPPQGPKELSGASGLVLGFVGSPKMGVTLRRRCSPHWHAIDLSGLGALLAHRRSVDLLVLEVGKERDNDRANVVVELDMIVRHGGSIPTVLCGPSEMVLQAVDRFRSLDSLEVASLQDADSPQFRDTVLDLWWRPFLSEVANSIRDLPTFHPLVHPQLAGLVSTGVVSFRRAAELSRQGVTPLPRFLSSLTLPAHRPLKKYGYQLGIDLRGFLRVHAVFQAALRVTPGAGYRTALRTGFPSAEALRIALRRELEGLGLRELSSLRVRSLIPDLLSTLEPRS